MRKFTKTLLPAIMLGIIGINGLGQDPYIPIDTAAGDIASTNHVSPWEDITKIYDMYDPDSSMDKGDGAFGNWDWGNTVGVWNYVEYEFHQGYKITSSEIYWWTDGGGILLPDTVYYSYLDPLTLKYEVIPNSLTSQAGGTLHLDQYNQITFDDTVETAKIRVNFIGYTEAQGILEWKVYGTASVLEMIKDHNIIIDTAAGDIASTNHVSPWEDITKIYDLYEPDSSMDKGDGAFGNWDWGNTVGVWNYVEYELHQGYEIGASGIYWWTDKGGILLPDTVYYSYLDPVELRYVEIPNSQTSQADGNLKLDEYNQIIFDEPVLTSKIRVNFIGYTEAQGILEWKIFGTASDVEMITDHNIFIDTAAGERASTNFVSPWEDITKIYDLYEPDSSMDKGDGAFGNWNWGNTVGTWNYVEYEFNQIYDMGASAVYWWTDRGGIILPDTVYYSYLDPVTLEYVEIPNSRTCQADDNLSLDKYNQIIFDESVSTSKIRVNFIGYTEAQGILEWKVFGNATGTLVDNEPPSVPDGLYATDSTSTTISLAWNPSTDDAGIYKYDVYQDNALIASVSETNHTATGLTANTEYTYMVKAIDNARNISAASEAITVTTRDVGDAIVDYTIQELKIYPNPVEDFVIIELNKPGEIDIEIFNSQGKLIYQKTYTDRIKINKSELSGTGTYIVRLITGKFVFIEKLIIE